MSRCCPGPLAVMAKSGTLSYEVGYRLVAVGLGQSLWVGVGGDPVKGVRFRDLLPLFVRHERTRGIVLIGEVGGSEEEEFADALRQANTSKPVYALVAGRGAKEGDLNGPCRRVSVRRCRHVEFEENSAAGGRRASLRVDRGSRLRLPTGSGSNRTKRKRAMNKALSYLIGTVALASFGATAADYPSKPITLIIPFAAGGSNDIVGRAIGKKLNEALGNR